MTAMLEFDRATSLIGESHLSIPYTGLITIDRDQPNHTLDFITFSAAC